MNRVRSPQHGCSLGVSPVLWSNDDLPELGENIPLEQCLAEASHIGYAGIELGHKFPRSPGALKRLVRAHGLEIVSGWFGGRLRAHGLAAEQEAMRAHLSLLAELGCRVMVYAEITDAVHGDRGASLEGRPVMGHDEAWKCFGEQLSELAQWCQDRGVSMAYHQHLGTMVQSEKDLQALVDHTSSAVGLCFDTGHAAVAGMDPVALAHRFAPRIRHVHCKDVRGAVMREVQGGALSFLEGVVRGLFTAPGDGQVNFAEVFGALADTGYEGWLVVEAEQDPALAPPEVYAQMGRQNVLDAALAAGLKVLSH